MKNLRVAILLIFCLPGYVQAQSEIDSLEGVLQSNVHDTVRIQVLTDLSYKLRKNDPEKGLKYAQEAIHLSEKLDKPRELGYAFLFAGMNERYLSNFQQSILLLNESQSLFREVKDSTGIALALNGLGIAYKQMGDYQKAATYYFASLEIYEKQGKPDKVAVQYNNLGNLYKNAQDLDQSLKFHRLALKLRQDIGNEGQIAYSYHNLSNTYSRMNQMDSALYYVMKALEIRRKDSDKGNLAATLTSMAGIYFKNEEYDLALDYIEEAQQLNLEIGDLYSQAECGGTMARCYMKLGNPTQALIEIRKALALSEELESIVIKLEVNSAAAHVFRDFGLYKEAYEAQTRVIALKDSLYTEDQKNQLAMFQTRFDVAEKERQIEAQKKLNQITEEKVRIEQEKSAKQERFVMALAGAGVLLIVVIAIMYRSAIHRKKTTQQLERQKREILLKNKSLETANEEISRQSDELAEKNKDITDSINYARKIQQSALPPAKGLNQLFSEAFVLYRPKDIIGGDFYWYSQQGDFAIVAVGDCTGHGVPGALMSMMALNLLTQIITDKNISSPSAALELLDKGIYQGLSVTAESETKDGMDIALIAINKKTGHMQFGGAARNILVLQEGELKSYRGSKNSIGGHLTLDKTFFDIDINLQKGDRVYLYTDGYPDQFGGPKGKKFKNKSVRQTVLNLSDVGMNNQRKEFLSTFENWKGDLEQIDDMCILGIEI